MARARLVDYSRSLPDRRQGGNIEVDNFDCDRGISVCESSDAGDDFGVAAASED